MDDKKNCAHATCTCFALPLQDYCCDACEEAALKEARGEKSMGKCQCLHADCGGEPEVSAETQGVAMASEALATP